MVKSAFTLIELIFAIVVIGIAVISLPTMNQATMKGIEGNMVQEAIFAASTELNQIVTANWDDNSLEVGAFNSASKVIDDGNCDNNSSSGRFRLKSGHINQPLHRKCLDANGTTPADANVNAVVSLNDMEHNASNIFGNTTTDGSGYKKRYNSAVSVTRPANFDGNNTNIKRIQITITDTSGNIITRLNTYSSNIGEIDYYKRSY